MTRAPAWRSAFILILTTIASTTLLSQVPPASMTEKLPTGTRIEAKQGSAWSRGVVSDDAGPQASQIKVRLGPKGDFMAVPRNSVRLVPRPTSINVGDHLEWYSSGTFSYEPATVKTIGSGTMAGWYQMVPDSYPKAVGTYTKPENLYVLPMGNGDAPRTVANPSMGKYVCQSYGAAGRPPIFLGELELRAGGEYAGFQKPGRYSYDAATQTITWISGGMKDNQFAGKVETNAVIRIRPTTICSLK